jgi:hypothetical protein
VKRKSKKKKWRKPSKIPYKLHQKRKKSKFGKRRKRKRRLLVLE